MKFARAILATLAVAISMNTLAAQPAPQPVPPQKQITPEDLEKLQKELAGMVDQRLDQLQKDLADQIEKQRAELKQALAQAFKAAAGAPLAVTLGVPASTPAWGVADIGVTVTNTSDQPLALLGVQLATDTGTAVASLAGTFSAPYFEVRSGLRLHGTYYVDDPGPAARAPRPSKWDWRGNDQLVTMLVLAPGKSGNVPQASAKLSGRLRARYDAGTKIRAVVQYAEVPVTSLLIANRVDFNKVEPREGEPPQMQDGLRPAASIMLEYQRRRSAWEPYPAIPDGPGKMDLPTIYNHALRDTSFARLQAQTVTAEAAFKIDRPAFDVDAARKATGVADGGFTRAFAADAWVLAAGDATHFATKDESLSVKGNALAFVDRLNQNGKARLDLYASAAAADPDGAVKFFADQGFAAQNHEQKGGGFNGTVTVTEGQLLAFLKAVNARGLKFTSDDTLGK